MCALALTLFSLGCSVDSDATGVPWSPERTLVVDADRSTTTIGAQKDDCLEYESACLNPQQACGELAADVVLDGKGKVLDYLCYPPESTLTVEQLSEKRGDIAQNQNNSVLVLDDADDGVDVLGDVSVDANNVVIYGSSPDTSVISGSLTLDGNNALVRGVRIQGDVTIVKNDVVLALCVIEGNLVLQGNNAKVLGCDVLGSVTVLGNNAKLYGDRIAGSVTPGKGIECKDSVSFVDTDGDHSVDTTELGAALSCG